MENLLGTVDGQSFSDDVITSNEFLFDFNFVSAMQMSSVYRWAIIGMDKSQSIAEHSFNVALMVRAIAINLSWDAVDINAVVELALMHDASELLTGDIPSPVKASHAESFREIESNVSPKCVAFKEHLYCLVPYSSNVLKIADLTDAYQYAIKHCRDYHRSDILTELKSKLSDCIAEFDSHIESPIDGPFSSVREQIEHWLGETI